MMNSSPVCEPSAFHSPLRSLKLQRLGDLQRQLLELSLAHQQVKIAFLEKQLQSVYHYVARQQLWQQQCQKSMHRVSSSETLESGDCETDESRSGQEAGYPTKASGLPWTQTESTQSHPVFRLEACYRRELFDAVPCTTAERKAKVHRYLLKMKAIRAKKVYSRIYSGRSETAKGKMRINGRFVKPEEVSKT